MKRGLKQKAKETVIACTLTEQHLHREKERGEWYSGEMYRFIVTWLYCTLCRSTGIALLGPEISDDTYCLQYDIKRRCLVVCCEETTTYFVHMFKGQTRLQSERWQELANSHAIISLSTKHNNMTFIVINSTTKIIFIMACRPNSSVMKIGTRLQYIHS